MHRTNARPVRRVLAVLLAAALTIGAAQWVLPVSVSQAEPEVLPYMDTSLSFAERAADLVSRMTLEEKASQIGGNNPSIDRLGVARYDYWKEGLHGIANLDEGTTQTATSFPYTIAMASSWDTEMIEAIGTAISDEARGYNNQGIRGLSYWSPTVNLARDPRWGRNHESYGEDVYLTSVLASSMVHGWQGDHEENNGYLKVFSTLKHYAANNSEYNRHNGTSNVDNVYLRDYYTLTFKNIIQETGIRQVMSSYNQVNGTPVSANTYLLDTLLRRTFGFRGYVVSDCGAIANMVNDHKWDPDGDGTPITYEEAVMYGLTAGCDMNCGSVYAPNAVGAVRSGILSEDVIDRALVRIFTRRFETGEFDPAELVPWRSEEYSYANQVESEEHVQLAEDTADESIVLLKNEAAEGESTPILPLDPAASQDVVVIGPLGNQNILGDYSGRPSPENLSTPVQGIEKLLGHNVTYIIGSGSTNEQYVCNTRNLKLIKGDEEVILTPSQATGFVDCQLENNANVGYIHASSYFHYPSVDISGTTAFAIETSGGGDTLAGTVELHLRSKDGYLLGKIDIEQTGSWGNYQYFQTTEPLDLGGYDSGDLYVTFTPPTSQETEMEFTPEETQAIQNADVVIACIGSNGGDSNEGHDRSTIAMPRNQDVLVKSVARLNPRTVAYIQSVGVLEIGEFKDEVPAILWTCYNGQAQGNAMARVIFGEHTPTAKLPFTWYASDSQLPTIDDYNLADEDYENGGWTYQYFTGDVDYPFGHGLSYTTFEYDNLTISAGNSYQLGDVDGDGKIESSDALMALQAATEKITLDAGQALRAAVDDTEGVSSSDALMILQAATQKIELPVVGEGEAVTPNDTVTVTVDVTNTGSVDSREVVQLYVSSPNADGLTRPFKQLKAFDKVDIAAGETETVTLTLDMEDCSFWNEEQQKFTYDMGTYTVMVGPSSDETRGLTGTFTMAGEYIPSLSVVAAIPDKVILNAARPDEKLTVELSATLSDDSLYENYGEDNNWEDLGQAEIRYESNRPEVAAVDQNGAVTGLSEGVATITVSVTVDGVTKTDSFPVAVVSELEADAILLDGEAMEGFSPATTTYYYPVEGNTPPAVSVPDMGDRIDVEITQAASVPGVATVRLTMDGESLTYTVNFRPQSTDYVAARFTAADGRYTASDKGTLRVDWKQVDGGQPVDLMTHHLSDLYLNMTLILHNGQEDADDSAVFRNGYIKLRSVDNNGENNRGWSVTPLELKSGVNYVSIPLSRVSEISDFGTIDWTQIDRFQMYIDSTNQYDGPFTMIVQDVMVVDARYGGGRQQLAALLDSTVNEADYTPQTYAVYQQAAQAAQTVLDNDAATDEQIAQAIESLLDAKAQLERGVDKRSLQEAVDYEFNEEEYTSDSVERYKAVLAEAEQVLENENATQAEVDAALRRLNDARNRLKRPGVEPVVTTFNNFNKEYSARNNNFIDNYILWADWTYADKYPVNLEGDRTGLYLIMEMTFNAPEGTDLTNCWEKITVKLRSEELNGENNYGWEFYPDDAETEGIYKTSTPGKYKIAIPLEKEKDNSTGNMDWGTTERIICTTDINRTTGNYCDLAGRSELTLTISDTQIVDTTATNPFDLEAWINAG